MAIKTTLPMYADELRKDVLKRLSRIEGQVKGVARMLESERPCLDHAECHLTGSLIVCGDEKEPLTVRLTP